MKKLILLLALLPLFASAQIPAVNDTTLFTGSTPFTPQFRFKNITLSGVNYRMPQVYNTILGKYDTYVTTKYLRAFYSGGGATDSTIYTTLNRYKYGADTLQNKSAYYLTLLPKNNSSIPTPPNGVNFWGENIGNSISFKGANGFTAIINNGNATQTNLYRLPATAGIFMLNPLTTAGDILYQSANSTTGTNLARRAIGSNGDVLTVSGGVPVWAAPTGGGAVTSVIGTTNRITVSPTTGNAVVDISPTFEALLEKVANKATNLTSPDNTKYPTTLAVSNAIAAKQSITPVASKGLISGNSTIAAYLGQNAVKAYLFSDCDQLNGTTIADISVPGNTILQQQTLYLADPDKLLYDWVVVEIGLNDLDPAETAATALARYQTYINNIRSNSKTSAVIIVSAMTPCRQRLIDVYGSTNGPIAYQKWLDMNVAIMGAGSNKITGVDGRIYNHVTALNDGLGNLAQQYDLGDGIHESNAGRLIIASAWRGLLGGLGYLTCFPPQTIDNNFTNGADSVKLKGGLLAINYKADGGAGLVINNTNTTNLGYSQLELKAVGSRFTMTIGNAAETLFGASKSFFIRDVRRSVNPFKIDSTGYATLLGTGANITDGSRGFNWRPYTGGSNYWAGYFSNVTPSGSNFFLAGRSEDETILNSTSSTKIAVGGSTKLEATSSGVNITGSLNITVGLVNGVTYGTTPPTATATGTTGQQYFDTSTKILYVCYNTNLWTRYLPDPSF